MIGESLYAPLSLFRADTTTAFLLNYRLLTFINLIRLLCSFNVGYTTNCKWEYQRKGLPKPLIFCVGLRRCSLSAQFI